MNAMIVSLNSAAEIWWQRTVSVSWQAAIVGLLLLALVWFGRRWSSQVHYALLLVALIKFAVPPLWSSPTGLLSQIGPVHQNAPETMASEFKRPNSGRRPPISAELDRRPEMATESVQTESQHVEADTELSPRDFQRPKTVIKNQRPMEPSQSATSPSTIVAVDIPRTLEKPTWLAILMMLHLAGMITVVALVIRQLRSLRRMVWNSCPVDQMVNQLCQKLQQAIGFHRRVRVLQSDAADSPITFGILRPTILLPVDTKELSHGDLKTILGHELAHLRQGDAWINWLQLLLMAAWWFHPVFWVLHRNLRRVREDCCDDSLIAGGLASADEYCSTLLRVARQSSSRRIHVACSMADGLHPLSKRLRRILDPGVRRRVRISIVNLMLVILAASVLLPGLRSQLIQSREATGAAKAVAAADEFAIPKDLPVAKPEIDRFAGYKEYATGFEPLKISGRCIDVNDKPVVGASVMLMLNEFGDLNYIDENGERQTINNKFATVQSDADGRYEFNTAQFPVKEYKPNPVEKPRDASFGLLATADDFAIAWRGSRTVRFQDRPAVLDPDEAASLFLPENQLNWILSSSRRFRFTEL